MTARIAITAYAGVAVVNVGAVLAQAGPLEVASKVALMPLLVTWVVLDARAAAVRWPASVRWLVAGLAFAWLGDIALLADGWFVGGIGAFAAMQVCYLVAFRLVPGPGLVRAWPLAIVPYAAFWIAVNIAVWPGGGDMRIPVLVYSALLVVMAVAAVDLVLRTPRPLGWRVAGGAALFVVSDALIALTTFGPLTAGPGWGAVVMATYAAAQAMIVTGFTRAVRGGPTRPARAGAG